MEIKYITEFVHLAQTCSFQETAADLYISQSSLTRHIQAIEQELGVPLFNRSTRKVVLNKYGEAFYAYAKRITDAYEDYTNVIRSLRSQNDQSLNIGTLGFVNFYGLYESLERFQVCYPHIKYRVIEERRDTELKRKLESGEFSFVFTSNYSQYPDFVRILWRRDDLVLAVPEKHPLARHDTVTLDQLMGYEILLHGPPIDYSNFFAACKKFSFQPQVNYVSFSTTIASLVAREQGISVINRLMCPTDVQGIKILPIVPRLSFNIFCIYPLERRLSQAEKEFLSFIAGNGEDG